MIKKFTKNSVLDWICPYCKNTSLEILKETLTEAETQSSLQYRKQFEDHDLESMEFSATGQLNCKNCNEKIFFIGESRYYHHEYYDEDTGDHAIDEGMEYIPKYVYPGIILFNIPKQCPDNIKKKIYESFHLFWTDSESCVNKIRQSLEILMNEFKVNKTYINKRKKRVNYNLHQRIEKFPIEDIRNNLLALKWIGNSGSHYGSELNEFDLENIYKILKYTLNKLYSTEEKEISKLTKIIIKNKGVSKKKLF